MRTSIACTTIVKHFEGLGDGDLKKPNLQVYICPAGVATWGYGHVLYHPVTGKMLKVSIFGRSECLRLGEQAMVKLLGRPWATVAEAEEYLTRDLLKFAAEVEPLLKGAVTTQLQFDAFVSLAFNVGIANFASSTLLRRHIARQYDAGNRDLQYLAKRSRAQVGITSTSEAFCAWSFSNGEWLAGLFKRRWVESAAYFGMDPSKAILIADTFKR